MISGVNHVTLAVRDLEIAFRFYQDTLGLQPVVRWAEGAYFSGGRLWLALIQDSDRSAEPTADYTHIAFQVDEADFAPLRERLQLANSKIWQPNRTEGDSVYFLDPDGHKLEVHASSLEARLRSMKANPRPDFHFFDFARVNSPKEL